MTTSRKVLDYLIKTHKSRTTQAEIARNIMVGCSHYENIKRESTTRKVREIISELRDKGIPILSDNRGYWISKDKEEIKEFIKMCDMRARAASYSYFHTRDALKRCRPLRQKSLFDFLFNR